MSVLQSAFRYVQISVLSFVLNLGLTVLLHEVFFINAEAAYAVALFSVFVMNFIAMRRYIFAADKQPVSRQFLAYSASAVGFRLTEYIVFIASHTLLGLDYRLLIISISSMATIAKFFYYRLLFSSRAVPAKDAAPTE